MAELALSEHRRLRFVTLSALYAAQGIPDAMILIVFPAYLAAKGVDAAAIGAFLATAMLPNTAKLLSGPMVDRLAFLPMGRRRPWVMFGQLGIAAAFVYLALLGDPSANLPLFTVGAFAVTLATVFQDVATDGMAMDMVPFDEQGKANGIMWGSKTLGTAIAASTGAAILATAGFTAMTISAAGVLIAVFAFLIFIRERPGERLLPWTMGHASAESIERKADGWRTIALQLLQAVRQPAAIRLIGVSISIGLIAGLSGAFLPVVIVQDFGWDDADYSQLRSGLKLAAGIAGMVAGGWLVDKVGHRRMLALLFCGMALANAAMALALKFQPAISYVAAYELLLVFLFIAFFAATMRQCWPKIAATQFSFTMVCGNIALVVGAAALGPLESLGGYFAVLVSLAIISIAAALIAATIRFDPVSRDEL